jgi:hypothetical protein
MDDPTLDPPGPASLPHTQPVITPGAISELRERVERLEGAVRTLTGALEALAPFDDAIVCEARAEIADIIGERKVDGVGQFRLRNEPLRHQLDPVAPRATFAVAEPDASTVEHVMELVQEYAFVFGCHESAVAPKRDALRAAVEKLARGEDPR